MFSIELEGVTEIQVCKAPATILSSFFTLEGTSTSGY